MKYMKKEHNKQIKKERNARRKNDTYQGINRGRKEYLKEFETT